MKNESQIKEREAVIHFELYRVIKNTLANGYNVEDTTFSDIEAKPRAESGEMDLLLKDSLKKCWLVIETKRFEQGKYVELIDPFSPTVIKQASDYATEIGAPYFATCNREVFVLFKTFKEFVPLPDRNAKQYDLTKGKMEDFVKELFTDLVNLELKKTEWTPRYKVLISRFRSLHNAIHPYIYESLLKKLNESSNFKKEYADWLEKEGFESSELRNRITAKETAYLLIDKIIFYSTIQKHYKDLPKLIGTNISSLKNELDNYFDKVTRSVDYIPVFERDQLFDKIPLPIEVEKLLAGFIEELSEYNFESIGADIMGQVYRDLIPKDEKKEFGQYYTDAHICDMIVKLCIHSPNDVVLDPGCGSGTFLIKAYQYLKTLKQKKSESPERIHKDLFEQLWGVEINQFPAHLSVMQLSMQDIETRSDDIHVIVNDFFRMHGSSFFEAQTAIHEHKGSIDIIPEVDDVVGNPPYIRQESIKDKNKIRKIALQDAANNNVDKKSNIYVYFFIYGLHFLKKNGKFGFITDNAWLDLRFGEGLEDFFKENCQINDIIYFDKNVFEDALTNTCITILTKKKPDETEYVKFIRVKKVIDIDELVRLVKTTNHDYEDENIKILLVKQKELEEETKWSMFIRAPPIYKTLKSNAKFEQLSNLHKKNNDRISEVRYAHKIGAERFFILTKEKAREWEIEPEFLRPVLQSPKQGTGIKINKNRINKFMLVVNARKSKLRGKNVLKYIEWGERTKIVLKRGKTKGEEVIGYQNVPSLKDKKIWYAYSESSPAPILFPKSFWDKYNIYLNDCAQATDNIYEVTPKSNKDIQVLLAYLNSSINAFFMEVRGTIPGGRDLALMLYDVQKLPVLDPAKLSAEEKTKLIHAFNSLLNSQEHKKDELPARNKLDQIVFEILGITDEKDKKQIINGLNDMRKIRQEGRTGHLETKIKTVQKIKKVKEKYVVRSLHHWIEK